MDSPPPPAAALLYQSAFGFGRQLVADLTDQRVERVFWRRSAFVVQFIGIDPVLDS